MGQFGERLKAIRTARNLSQADLAQLLGVSGAYISALENGKKQPPPHALVIGLASILNVDADELWRLAKAEREDRLRARIEGTPTAKRKSVINQDKRLNFDVSADIVTKELYARFPDKAERERVIALLRDLFSLLKK